MPETAKEKLKRITAWDIAPALTDGEIDALLVETSLADTNGLPPTETDWQPTYDLNLAATAAWLIKAGRAAQLTEVDPVGSGIVTSKVFDNCRAMARIYQVKGGLTIQIKPPNL
jgi:hypothetical protein